MVMRVVFIACLLSTAIVGAAAIAQQALARAALPTQSTPASAKKAHRPEVDERQPVDFRCDGMQILTEPNRSICRGNVVVRRPDLLLCCQRFEGFADKDWQWQNFTCLDDVRAFRAGETMWAEKGEFIVSSYDLILTGNPLLQRGNSLLHGDRIVVDIKTDKATVERPRGRIANTQEELPPMPQPVPLNKPLPETCPLAARP